MEIFVSDYLSEALRILDGRYFSAFIVFTEILDGNILIQIKDE